MAISVQDYAKALQNAVHESGSKDADKIIQNLVEILKSNNDLDKYEGIVEEFEKLELEAGGIKKIQMDVAGEFSINKDIVDDLNSYAKTQVKIEQHTDDSLIGGVVLRVDDTLIDASIRGGLENLREDLTK